MKESERFFLRPPWPGRCYRVRGANLMGLRVPNLSMSHRSRVYTVWTNTTSLQEKFKPWTRTIQADYVHQKKDKKKGE